MVTLRKLFFQEAWDTLTIVYVDEELEDEIHREVAQLLEISRSFSFPTTSFLEVGELAELLKMLSNPFYGRLGSRKRSLCGSSLFYER